MLNRKTAQVLETAGITGTFLCDSVAAKLRFMLDTYDAKHSLRLRRELTADLRKYTSLAATEPTLQTVLSQMEADSYDTTNIYSVLIGNLFPQPDWEVNRQYLAGVLQFPSATARLVYEARRKLDVADLRRTAAESLLELAERYERAASAYAN